MQPHDSLCDDVLNCTMYNHMHCCNCDAVLDAQGEGPVYAGGKTLIDGYFDEHGKRAVPCANCQDDFYLLCSECCARNPNCRGCQLEQAVV